MSIHLKNFLGECFEYGVEISGNRSAAMPMYNPLNADNPALCQSLCASKTDCTAFVFEVRFLKNQLVN
jgi:hypothetical protein